MQPEGKSNKQLRKHFNLNNNCFGLISSVIKFKSITDQDTYNYLIMPWSLTMCSGSGGGGSGGGGSGGGGRGSGGGGSGGGGSGGGGSSGGGGNGGGGVHQTFEQVCTSQWSVKSFERFSLAHM